MIDELFEEFIDGKLSWSDLDDAGDEYPPGYDPYAEPGSKETL